MAEGLETYQDFDLGKDLADVAHLIGDIQLTHMRPAQVEELYSQLTDEQRFTYSNSFSSISKLLYAARDKLQVMIDEAEYRKGLMDTYDIQRIREKEERREIERKRIETN